MGFINFQNYVMPSMLENASLENKLAPDSGTSVDPQCVECSSNTKYMCVQCSSNPYCKICFVKVHAVGVIIKTHELEQIGNMPITIGRALDVCKDHGKKRLDYYCQSCLSPICSICVSTSHSKHETTNLLKNVSDISIC